MQRIARDPLGVSVADITRLYIQPEREPELLKRSSALNQNTGFYNTLGSLALGLTTSGAFNTAAGEQVVIAR